MMYTVCLVSEIYCVLYEWCYSFFCSDYLFFFFKQKTAYEMRISDWSSDVCSSDLNDETRAIAIRTKDLMLSLSKHEVRKIASLQLQPPTSARWRATSSAIEATVRSGFASSAP